MFWFTRRVAAIAILLAVGETAGAQTPPTPAFAQRSAAIASADGGCNTVERPISAGGASIVPEAAGQQKNWQQSLATT